MVPLLFISKLLTAELNSIQFRVLFFARNRILRVNFTPPNKTRLKNKRKMKRKKKDMLELFI